MLKNKVAIILSSISLLLFWFTREYWFFILLIPVAIYEIANRPTIEKEIEEVKDFSAKVGVASMLIPFGLLLAGLLLFVSLMIFKRM